MIATNFPALDVFFTTLYVVAFAAWLVLVFHVVADVFRSHDLSGGAKALWVLFIVIMPLVGTLIYVVIRGGAMHERQVQVSEAQRRVFEEYVRTVANTKE